MISAAAAYADAANAAALAFARTPALIAYRIEVETSDGAGRRTERSQVVLRTADGSATVRDAAGAPHDESAPPALPPAVDALAEWAFTADVRDDRVRLRVAYQNPRSYAFPTPGPDIDIVAENIAGYDVRYVDGDPNHVQLIPSTPETRELAREPDHFVYRDVFIDPQTSLPARVVLAAPDESITLDYGSFEGHWLLSRLAYDAVLHGKSRKTTRHYTVEARYSEYAFPTDPSAKP